uniref:Trafficking protein particle complex subunit 8 (Trinotate prediction) n=1 Tax=Myxobolus squamalis TaxID=59785 RepID=A0A6B2FY66_MYXSQ
MVVPDQSDYVHSLIGCILVASTLDENILSTYNNLNASLDLMINSNQSHKNSYIKFFERNIFKYYVLVHDQTLVKQEKLDSDVSALKNIFGTSFFVLLLSAQAQPTNSPSRETNPWYFQKLFIPSSFNAEYPLNDMTDFFNSPLYLYRCFSAPSFSSFDDSPELEDKLSISRKDCGKLLSLQDRDNIKKLMEQFFVSGLIPHLGSTLDDIQFVVNEKNPKKSVLLNAKSFFKTSILSKNSAPSTSTAIKFRAHPESWEILTKKLADLFFILKKF